MHCCVGEVVEKSLVSSVTGLVKAAVSARSFFLAAEAEARLRLAVRLFSDENDEEETRGPDEGIDHRLEFGAEVSV